MELLLQWATINGAQALQVDDKFGSFEKGKTPGVLLLGEGVHDTTILLLAVTPHHQTRLCVTYINGKLKDRFDPKRLRLYENADDAIQQIDY